MNQKTPGNNTHQNQNHQEDALGYSLGIHCKNSLALPDLCEGSELDLRNFPTELPPLFIKEEEGNEKTVSTLAKRPVISLFENIEARNEARKIGQSIQEALSGLNLDFTTEIQQLKSKLVRDVLIMILKKEPEDQDYMDVSLEQIQLFPEKIVFNYRGTRIGTVSANGLEEKSIGFTFTPDPEFAK